jgi:hypothetical protein
MTALADYSPKPEIRDPQTQEPEITGLKIARARSTGLPWAVAILAMAGGGVVSLVWLFSSLHAAYRINLFIACAALVLPVVIALALAGVRALSAERARAAVRARALNRLVESNRFFALRPGEAAIRQHLAEAICDLTGKGAAITGAGGALGYRAGVGAQWRGAIEAELVDLSQRAVDSVGVEAVPMGVFRARTDSLNPRVFGAAVWVRPAGSAAFIRETDQYVAMLIELASAAIVQCRKSEALADGAAPGRFGEGGGRQIRRFGLV